MREKGFERVSDFVGKSAPRIKQWGDLDLNYKIVAEIDQHKCIHCGLCYIACEDGAHQSIRWDKVPMAEFVQSNGHSAAPLRRRRGAARGRRRHGQPIHDQAGHLRRLQPVLPGRPVEGCITMKEVDTGKPPMTWNEYQKLLAEGKVEKIRPPEHV